MEFNVEIFKALKIIIDMDKFGKNLENCNAYLENADVYSTVNIVPVLTTCSVLSCISFCLLLSNSNHSCCCIRLTN